jgi:hypothetical protein
MTALHFELISYGMWALIGILLFTIGKGRRVHGFCPLDLLLAGVLPDWRGPMGHSRRRRHRLFNVLLWSQLSTETFNR